MRLISASEVHGNLDYDGLVEALRLMFRSNWTMPPAQQLPWPEDSDNSELSIEPVWGGGRALGIKTGTYVAGNRALGLQNSLSNFLLLDGKTGYPRALIDGGALTLRRTAAASALAASYLARPDSERLLVIGTGPLATQLLEAHIKIRPIRNVLIWGRDPAKAQRMAQRLTRRALKVAAATDLASAVSGAHIITSATASVEPLIKGEWLPSGVHLDLVGGRTASSREADDACMAAGRVFVDLRSGPVMQAGDIAGPLASGILVIDDIAGDLVELARGSRAGRRYYDQATLFKSVGTVLEDLAAALRLLDVLRE